MMTLSTNTFRPHYKIYKLGDSNQPSIYAAYKPAYPLIPTKSQRGTVSGMSKIEQKYSDSPHITNREERFPKAIISNGVPYTFRTDGYLPALGVYLEFKSNKSNPKKDVITAFNKLLSQARFHRVISNAEHDRIKALVEADKLQVQRLHDYLSGLLYPKHRNDCLEHAFNHSKHKLALVSKYFNGQLLVVYANAVKLTERDIATLRKLGITAINERQLDSILKQLDKPSPDLEAIRKEVNLPRLHLPQVRTLH